MNCLLNDDDDDNDNNDSDGDVGGDDDGNGDDGDDGYCNIDRRGQCEGGGTQASWRPRAVQVNFR